MIRGSQTITSIFSDTTAKPKRVNGAFTIDRDIAIAYRLYYYYHIERIRFDDAVQIMENEFYISSSTIMKRITENDTLLKDIMSNKPTKAQLKKRYPHLNWN